MDNFNWDGLMVGCISALDRPLGTGGKESKLARACERLLGLSETGAPGSEIRSPFAALIQSSLDLRKTVLRLQLEQGAMLEERRTLSYLAKALAAFCADTSSEDARDKCRIFGERYDRTIEAVHRPETTKPDVFVTAAGADR